jgi:NADPH:quinone reductase-like Zn-dependent oxidoreductase
LKRKLHVHGISVGSRDTFEEMNRAIAAWKLKPVVDRTFALADVQTAFRYLESGKHFGKVVITL